MAELKHWIAASRPRTLPLALASILLGSFLAWGDGELDPLVLTLGILTTLFLQILSNFANDYGDTQSGADNEERVGPQRTMQAGHISMKEMRVAILLCVILALFTGVWLILEGTKGLSLRDLLIYLLLGVIAIIAAIKYTVGRNPYGYAGLGDPFVFIFFGLVGTIGIHYLHTNDLSLHVLYPAVSFGFLSTGVLNINNLRDRAADKKFGKRTLAVILGRERAIGYHFFLIVGAMILAIIHSILHYRSLFQFLYLLTFPFFFIHLRTVWKSTDHRSLDPQLKLLAISSLLFAIAFGVGWGLS